MTVCELCQKLVGGERVVPAHSNLTQMEQTSCRSMYGTVLVTSYRCTSCGTEWNHTEDRQDKWLGWERCAKSSS